VKVIIAVIQPFLLDRVARHLRGHVNGLTCWDVRGFGTAEVAATRMMDLGDYFSARVRLEMVVLDQAVEEVLTILQTYASTGKPGDGKVFVLAVEDVLRLRTGERGEAALLTHQSCEYPNPPNG